jgi:glycosyltransferase involved in cell wall biosynthesis
MKEAILNASEIISFNTEMIKSIENKIGVIKYHLIPQSVMIDSNKNNYDNNKFSLRKKLNIPDEYKITLFPAGIRAVKDPKFALNEMLELLEEHQDHVIILIGARLDRELYQELLRITINQKRFIIHNVVPHKEFMEVIKESDLILNTSISEGMSNVLMESMKFKVPILARKNEGNCKLIKHSENGLIFTTPEEFKSLYKQIYSDRYLKEKLINRAELSLNELFNTQIEKENYKNLLDNIFSNSNPQKKQV